jgi:hypothetical protein
MSGGHSNFDVLHNNSGSEPSGAGDAFMSELTFLVPVQLGILLPYANIPSSKSTDFQSFPDVPL